MCLAWKSKYYRNQSFCKQSEWRVAVAGGVLGLLGWLLKETRTTVRAPTTIFPEQATPSKAEKRGQGHANREDPTETLFLPNDGSSSCSLLIKRDSQFVLAFLSSIIKTTPLSSSGKWLLACKVVARLIQPDFEQLGNSWRWYKWP